MPFELKILGSNSANPVYNRHQSAQLLNIEDNFFLIDCGEATQHQLLRYKIKFNKINHIFISHLHGDHYLGLVGLLSTMHLHGRKKELMLFGPPGLGEIITLQLKYSETFLTYKIIFHEVETEKAQIIFETDTLWVESIPLKHRIKCAGYLFKEKPKRRRLNKKLLPDNLSLANIVSLKNGNDAIDTSGSILFKNEDVTLPPKKSRSYGYCSDTIYLEENISQLLGVDLLYHESTFLDDMRDRAKETYHTTALQAGTFAVKANVGKLIIGHYSSRYKDLTPLLMEAKSVFTNTCLAIEGELISLADE